MRIAIVSDDGKSIPSPFHKSKGYLIYDLSGSALKKVEFRNGSYSKSHKISTSNLIKSKLTSGLPSILSDCDIVVSKGIGRSLFNLLKSAGKKVYLTVKDRPEEALYDFLGKQIITGTAKLENSLKNV